MFLLSTIPFQVEATRLIGLVQDGDDLVAPGSDPQVLLQPSEPIPAGWCEFVLEAEGRIQHPRIYFDFGEGFAEPASVKLDSFEEDEPPHAAIFLRAPSRGSGWIRATSLAVFA